MKRMILMGAVVALLIAPAMSMAESARCVVVQSDGNVLTMECAKREGTFQKGARVKIKTDRDKQ